MSNVNELTKMQLFTGKEYLQIDIANNLGFDKLNYDERIKKFKELMPKDSELVTYSDEAIVALLHDLKANEAELAFAGVIAYINALKGIKDGYCVAFDAICSGTQIMSAMTNCVSGCKYTGLLDHNRYDLYTEVYKRFKDNAKNLDKITRNDIKKAVMTVNYGSRKEPVKILGENNIEAFHKAMNEVCPGAFKLMKILTESWDSTKDVVTWIMPDNFNVYIPVMRNEIIDVPINKEFKNSKVTLTKQGNVEYSPANAANAIHSIDAFIAREITRRCMNDTWLIHELERYKEILNITHQDVNYKPTREQCIARNDKLGELAYLYDLTGILTIRIAEYINNFDDIMFLSYEHRKELFDLLIKLKSQGRFELYSIHDSFKCLPNYMNYVRYHYNDLMSQISKGKLLHVILSQLNTGMDVTINPAIANAILNSNYAIT